MFLPAVHERFYARVLKPYFFSKDPEAVHDRMCGVGKRMGQFSVTRRLTKRLFHYQHPALEQEILGIQFANPIGLAAGFDKNAELTQILPDVGFGFEEVGSITGEPCEGNPKPRLWRLPESQGLVVYYGLKNDGAEAIARRLRDQVFRFPLGTSVAKTNNPLTVGEEQGIADYEKAFQLFANIGDYFTVNISCPNAFGGEPFSDPVRLDRLLDRLDQVPTDKPVFIKLAVDMNVDDVDALLEVTDRHRVHGFVVSNLTKRRDRKEIQQSELAGIERGGISGRPTQAASNTLISEIHKRAGSRYVIIGVGGIFTAQDAYDKIRCGASLIQLATGMIFRGPQLIGQLNKGLVELLKKDGFTHISQTIGSAHR